MNRPSPTPPRGAAARLLLLGALAAAGCSAGTPADPSDPTRQNLDKLGVAYLRATMKLNRPPANLKELMPLLQEFDRSKPEQILHSPNDGQDFVIVWGVELRKMMATGNAVPIVAYEKAGKDGKRYVLRGRADVVLMSDGELRGATFPSGYNPLP
jgi:hypothetical protein